MVVYDISDRSTFNIAKNIIHEIRGGKHQKSSTIPISIIGNKQDLENGRKVSFDEGQQLALKSFAKFFEVSFKHKRKISILIDMSQFDSDLNR